MFSRFSTTPPAFRDDVLLKGNRIALRPLRVSDAGAMFVYASDPAVTEFLPWEPAPTVDSVRPFLQDQVARRKQCDSIGFAIVDNQTGDMIGSTDLMDLRTVKGQAELGYLIGRPFWGQGLMTESANLTIQFGFRELNLKQILACADRDNVASRRVMEKIGMSLVATETRLVKEQHRPYVRYELTRAAWESDRDKSVWRRIE